MITSIMDICADNGMNLKDTVYANSYKKMLEFKIVSGDFYEFAQNKDGKNVLLYKNCLEITDFPLLKEQLPQLAGVNYSIRDELPYFTSGLEELAEKISLGEKVAVEGGPCLFGTDEVLVEIIRKNGKKDYFDYNTGKSYFEHEQEEDNTDFGEFVKAHAGKIQALHFRNRKAGLTPQEWAFIKYPFEIANAFSAPLVIPIPDMSYVKYLKAVLNDVDDKVRNDAIEEFRQVEYEISDLYINVIDRMRNLHKNVHCEVVHERDKELCRKFYEARSVFMERNKIARNLTGIPEKMESVRDYVSMPALPYYLYGINNVIEVDSMDEADSFRKCRKAHKGKLNLSCILFPELLSTDKVNTIFNAPWDRKEYGKYVVE
ncbi:MAG: hypothetical protein ACI4E1_10450 [Lachnospira sp.]